MASPVENVKAAEAATSRSSRDSERKQEEKRKREEEEKRKKEAKKAEKEKAKREKEEEERRRKDAKRAAKEEEKGGGGASGASSASGGSGGGSGGGGKGEEKEEKGGSMKAPPSAAEKGKVSKAAERDKNTDKELAKVEAMSFDQLEKFIADTLKTNKTIETLDLSRKDLHDMSAKVRFALVACGAGRSRSPSSHAPSIRRTAVAAAGCVRPRAIVVLRRSL
jgi:hypothetical protein